MEKNLGVNSIKLLQLGTNLQMHDNMLLLRTYLSRILKSKSVNWNVVFFKVKLAFKALLFKLS
jgi:hypothetical protein